MKSRPSSMGGNRLITGFGSAALTSALVQYLRKLGPSAASCVVLTPLPARARNLGALLSLHGLDVQVQTLADYAAREAKSPGKQRLSATSDTRRWFLFCRALRDCPEEVSRALAPSPAHTESLQLLLDALVSNSVSAQDMESVKDSAPVADSLAKFLACYENILQEKDVASRPRTIEMALKNLALRSDVLFHTCIFDSMHDARPEELKLAAGSNHLATTRLFLCDPWAPPPAGRVAARDVKQELTRLIPGLAAEEAPPSPNEELGRRITSGALDSLGDEVELLQFNDSVSECRGIAGKVRAFELEEGIPLDDMAVFTEGGTQAQMLQYEIEHARGVQSSGTARFFAGGSAPLEREVRLVLGLLTDPGRPGLKRRAILGGMAADEPGLEAKLSRALDSGEFTNAFETALQLLLPDASDAERKALDIYTAGAAEFATFAATGELQQDLSLFAYSLGGYLERFPRESSDVADIFITPFRPAAKHYRAVFLPSLMSSVEPIQYEVPGTDVLSPALERKLGRPVYLPAAKNREARLRYDCAAAAAAGARVVFSYYRQQGGRSVRPVSWFQKAVEHAKPEPVVESTGSSPLPPATPGRVEVPTVLSASSIAAYVTCPHMFFLRRILGLEGPRSEHMSLGLLVHRVLAEFHRPGRTDFSTKQMHRLLDETAAGSPLLPESLAEARALLDVYAGDMTIGTEETLAVERSFELELGGARIHGRIDRLVALEDGVKVIDYKTRGKGKQRKHKNAVARLDDIQLPLYTLAARGLGYEVKAFSYIYLNYDNTGKPYEVLLRFAEEKKSDAMTAAELQEPFEKIEGVVGEILAGKYEYEKGEHAPCRRQANWCEFSGMCTLAGE